MVTVVLLELALLKLKDESKIKRHQLQLASERNWRGSKAVKNNSVNKVFLLRLENTECVFHWPSPLGRTKNIGLEGKPMATKTDFFTFSANFSTYMDYIWL